MPLGRVALSTRIMAAASKAETLTSGLDLRASCLYPRSIIPMAEWSSMEGALLKKSRGSTAEWLSIGDNGIKRIFFCDCGGIVVEVAAGPWVACWKVFGATEGKTLSGSDAGVWEDERSSSGKSSSHHGSESDDVPDETEPDLIRLCGE